MDDRNKANLDKPMRPLQWAPPPSPYQESQQRLADDPLTHLQQNTTEIGPISNWGQAAHTLTNPAHSVEPKGRRRGPRGSSACSKCRSAKAKCDEARPRCGRCKSIDHECKYSDVLPSRQDLFYDMVTTLNDNVAQILRQQEMFARKQDEQTSQLAVLASQMTTGQSMKPGEPQSADEFAPAAHDPRMEVEEQKTLSKAESSDNISAESF